MFKNKYLIILLFPLFGLAIVLTSFSEKKNQVKENVWEFQSIDTMKYSRDLAREKLNDSNFDFVIDQQVKDIAGTGATHVAIATPYDAEFSPVLKRWVDSARRYKLKVWFRGNFSGWEGWFGYSTIDRDTHKKMTEEFILGNKNLFKDGDIFTACPECENGGPGDPRVTGDIAGHRKFLIEEHQIAERSFKKIRVNVKSNINSMNGDVAKAVMDRPTTQALGGIVAVDHYVKDVDKLISDIKEYAELSGGDVVLGEFGAPIPDLHGEFTEEEQAAWIETAMSKLILLEELKGINYWVNVGGSTELWDVSGKPRLAVDVVKHYFHPQQMVVSIENGLAEKINRAEIVTFGKSYMTDNSGSAKVPYYGPEQKLEIFAKGYSTNINIVPEYRSEIKVIMNPIYESRLYQLRKKLKLLFN